jgi:hypothetical protein
VIDPITATTEAHARLEQIQASLRKRTPLGVVQVLPGHRGQQRARLSHRPGRLAAVQQCQQRMRVAGL